MVGNQLSVILLCLILVPTIISQNWKKGANGAVWDSGCDFANRDLHSVRSSGEDCGGICARTSECDHFTWTTFEGGTCWLKYSYNPLLGTEPAGPEVICGIIHSKVTWTHPIGK